MSWGKYRIDIDLEQYILAARDRVDKDRDPPLVDQMIVKTLEILKFGPKEMGVLETWCNAMISSSESDKLAQRLENEAQTIRRSAEQLRQQADYFVRAEFSTNS